MYPIAHAWLIQRLVPDATPAHYLGCVWPDMLYDSPLTHPQSHRSGRLLAERARGMADANIAEVARAFVVGALSHGSEPRGFDWYSDEEYGGQPGAARGFAFQHGLALADETAEACGIDRAPGWWKAHNIVEMACERPLHTANPALGERLAAACADAPLRTTVAGFLAGVFGVPADALAAPMRRFAGVVALRPASHAALAEVYALQVRLKHPGATPDVDALAGLIARAERAIAPEMEGYLDTCTRLVGEMLRGEMGGEID
jgi:hypothetical protein